jgi:hypothetical protein
VPAIDFTDTRPAFSVAAAGVRAAVRPIRSAQSAVRSQANLFTDELADDEAVLGVNLVTCRVSVLWPTGNVIVPCTPSSDET